MPRELLAVLIRHGDTALNDDNSFRSQLDPPLNKKGLEQADLVADIIKRRYDVYKITSSPMLRAMQTADKIADAIGAKVHQDRGLFPWALGFLAGRDKDEYAHILDYYVDNPKQKIPDGQSLDEFENRVQDFFDDALRANYKEAATGTLIGGYAEQGPYHCKDCIHKTAADKPYCTHPKIVGSPQLKDKLVKIGGKKVVHINLEHGCCEYVKPEEDKKPRIQCFITHTSDIVTLANLFLGRKDKKPEQGEEVVGTGGLAEIWLEDGGEYSLKAVLDEKPAKFGE